MSAVALAVEPFDLDRIEAITARLDLRQPNKEALESIVFEIAQHYEIDREPPPFEAVADVATGVGKTYVLASVIEYLAAEGVHNFAVIVPGRTILDKTVANFTPGHPKSLLGGMEVRPIVVTSENFATAAMRAAMDDPGQVKLFIFTVQALLRPDSKVGRRTHKFQEGLGEAFYAHLQGLDDLVVFADEHHTYYGAKFSAAVRELRPRVLIGLTATPHRSTPPDRIIFRYPLAAAIADKLVKTPVLVGRKDDRTDARTKLLDGVRLLELKEQVIGRWRQETGAEAVTPVMLVIAPSIAEAEEVEGIVADASFAGGRYAGKVLTVHSDAPDEALAQLDRLEAPDNPYRIVVSVGMLKEGWDVKNVYVIASLRASVSEILTEQTLGRGLRLPFGRYTGIEILDTLEVLGHERYEDLLRKAGALNEQFIDRRTRAVLRRNAEGRLVPVTETTTVQAPVVADDEARSRSPMGAPRPTVEGAAIRSVEEHMETAEEVLLGLQTELAPRSDLPSFAGPVAQDDNRQESLLARGHHRFGAVPAPGREYRGRPERKLAASGVGRAGCLGSRWLAADGTGDDAGGRSGRVAGHSPTDGGCAAGTRRAGVVGARRSGAGQPTTAGGGDCGRLPARARSAGGKALERLPGSGVSGPRPPRDGGASEVCGQAVLRGGGGTHRLPEDAHRASRNEPGPLRAVQEGRGVRGVSEVALRPRLVRLLDGTRCGQPARR